MVALQSAFPWCNRITTLWRWVLTQTWAAWWVFLWNASSECYASSPRMNVSPPDRSDPDAERRQHVHLPAGWRHLQHDAAGGESDRWVRSGPLHDAASCPGVADAACAEAQLLHRPAATAQRPGWVQQTRRCLRCKTNKDPNASLKINTMTTTTCFLLVITSNVVC